MKFEELESAWHMQSAGTATAAEAQRVARHVAQGLDRRALYLKLLLGCTAVGWLLEFEPLFQLLRARPGVDGLSYAASLAKFLCHQALYGAFMVFLVRRLRQHAQQVRASGESLQAAASMSLTAVESEVRDYRRAGWFALPMTALMLWSAWLNQAVAREGLTAFWPRAALVIGFVTIVTLVARHYYFTQLLPGCEQLRTVAQRWKT
jgi:hypothetical protein